MPTTIPTGQTLLQLSLHVLTQDTQTSNTVEEICFSHPAEVIYDYDVLPLGVHPPHVGIELRQVIRVNYVTQD